MDRWKIFMKKKNLVYWGFIFLLSLSLSLEAQTTLIKGAEIHPMNGRGLIQNGDILIENGRISYIGEKIDIQTQGEIIDAAGFILYPGFIITTALQSYQKADNFESFSPDLSVTDRFDYYGDYSFLLKGGITSICLNLPSDRLIPGKCAILKLGGKDPERQTIQKEASLQINLGRDPILPPEVNIFPAPVSPENPLTPAFMQYPSSPLGAFLALLEIYKFKPTVGEQELYWNKIALTLSNAKMKKLPLLIQCHKAADIILAIEFSEKLELPLILYGAAEAYKLIDLLKSKRIPIIAEWPSSEGGAINEEDLVRDGYRINPEAISLLMKNDIRIALTAEADKQLPELFRESQYFQRYGISQEELIRSLTVNPAQIFRIDERVGLLAKGRDADILFFQKESGVRFLQLKKVMIEGKIVYEK